MIKYLFYGAFEFKGALYNSFIFTFQIDSHEDSVFLHPFETQKGDGFKGLPSWDSDSIKGEYDSRSQTIKLEGSSGIKIELKKDCNDCEWTGTWLNQESQEAGSMLGVLSSYYK